MPPKVASQGYKTLRSVEAYVRECGLPMSLIELVKMRASQINGCAFCHESHSSAELVGHVRRERETGCPLLAEWDGACVVAAAGYRLQENLIRGRFVYIDDLVVLEEASGFGLGACLLEEVARLDCDAGCVWLALDTALGNALAQRFYFRHGLLATGLHFGMSLD